jgi:ABC-type sugar transport system ATPase subunit
MSEYILELNEITKIFPGVRALNNVHFDLKPGEIHAICGENGAGKSTLIKIVAGVHKPDQGQIFVNGKEVSFQVPMDSLKSGVAVIYQETSLFEEMTVLENLFLCHEPKKHLAFFSKLDYKTMYAKAKEKLSSLGTDINPNAYIKELGMAQKQMVEIAKALTYDSKILIFDEPTASLTNQEVKLLFKIINKLKNEGVGIIYISHRLNEIFELCDRVTVVRDGKLICVTDVRNTTEDELIRNMVGREVIQTTKIFSELIEDEDKPYFCVNNLSIAGYVRDINFHCNKHEIIGFAGLAGAGRTEMAEGIVGLRKLISGDISLDNQKLLINDNNDAMNQGLAYVSEDRGKYALINSMSVAKNIALPQMENLTNNKFINSRKERDLATKYISRLNIRTPNEQFIVDNLSGGNQQKVALAKFLAVNPKVLILDEPTRGVDVGSKSEIHKIISNLAKEEMAIIVISSELPELLNLCNRIYVVKEGKIAKCFDRHEATQERILEVAFKEK